ncbi:fatty acid hydroxylase domain-containing protein 2-like [Neocloeon triangulifer]|uniref:fatty acid hydroxylase domain-containing protein 2-like n=1 Tax=Neocloeon triangulifer TaxID=2078957 RepID=UPI00286F0854|nr:fatty acid hydroxylase domain-containing protein 2-like [Neocloeon triangulifer]
MEENFSAPNKSFLPRILQNAKHVLSLLPMIVTVYLQLFLYTVPLLTVIVLAREWAPTPYYWEQKWGTTLAWIDQNRRLALGFVPSFIAAIMYWLVGAIFLVFDFTGWMSKYKTQPGTNEPLQAPRLTKVVKCVLINQFVVGMSLTLLMHEITRLTSTKEQLDLNKFKELPSISTMLIHLAVFATVREVLNYYTHRLMHHRLFYKNVHKQHHMWSAPIALISIYCHPVEHIIVNAFPAITGPILMKSHPLVLWSWFLLVQPWSMIIHSGYHFPLFPCPEFHDFHHMTSTSNFGNLTIMDAIHGTDKQWKKSESYKRSFTLFGVKPAREIIKRLQ